jgi:alkanesulfonate monooxygenase SsuD/methylene tetrahydromethanopterin reductase-like flavin-dependent oxidoreductase (luciferase family)
MVQVAEEALELVVTGERLGFKVAWRPNTTRSSPRSARALTILGHWAAYTQRIRQPCSWGSAGGGR